MLTTTMMCLSFKLTYSLPFSKCWDNILYFSMFALFVAYFLYGVTQAKVSQRPPISINKLRGLDDSTRATTSFLNCINFVFVQQVTTTADNHKTQKYCWKRPFRNFNAEVTSWGTPLCPSHAHFVSQNQSLLYVPLFLFWSTIDSYI